MTGLAPLAQGEPGPSFTAIVESAARSAAGLVASAASWWTVPSTSLTEPVVADAQGSLRPLLLVVLAGSLLVQAARLVAGRGDAPVLSVGVGLLRFGLAAALGVTVLQGALVAGDALAANLVGDAGVGFGDTMRDALTTRRDGLAEPFLLLLLSMVVLVLSAAQWMAMAVRQVALLAVAATLPLAAAGSLTAATRGWLSRLAPWGLALVIYKPAAALIHAAGQRYLAQIVAGAASGVTVVLAGIVVLALGVAALPVSLRLLSFTSVRIAGAAIRGADMAAAVGAVRLTGRVGGGSAVQLAAFMRDAGPGETHRPALGARPGAAPALAAGYQPPAYPTDQPASYPECARPLPGDHDAAWGPGPRQPRSDLWAAQPPPVPSVTIPRTSPR